MEIVKELVPLLFTISLSLLLVSAAMASSEGDFAYVITRPNLLFRAFLAILLIPLAAALLIAPLFPISAPSRAAIALMAISPVPPLVLGKALKSGADRAFVYGLLVAAGLMALVWVPGAGAFLARYYNVEAQFPPMVVARNVFIGVVVPLGVGLLIGRHILHGNVGKWPGIISKLAMALLVIAVLPLLFAVWPALMKLIGDGTALVMAILTVIAVAGGHILGGPEAGFRPALAFASAIRHPGIALALAGANHANKSISAAVLLFVIISFIVLTPYQIWVKRSLGSGPAG